MGEPQKLCEVGAQASMKGESEPCECLREITLRRGTAKAKALKEECAWTIQENVKPRKLEGRDGGDYQGTI